jgi:hypothetical protein
VGIRRSRVRVSGAQMLMLEMWISLYQRIERGCSGVRDVEV